MRRGSYGTGGYATKTDATKLRAKALESERLGKHERLDDAMDLFFSKTQ
jgi:hypothetical protein